MAKNFLLILASLALTLIFLDFGFRLFPPQNLQMNDPGRYTQLFGEMRPGVPLTSYMEKYPLDLDPRGYYQRSNGTIFYFFDNFGGRWTEAAGRHLGKNVGILVGDSFTYGFGLRYEDTFSYQLERQSPSKLELVNLAYPSADSERALAIYEKARMQIPHRILIYGLHLNDLIEFPTSFIATNQRLGFISDHSPFVSFVLQKWDIVFNQPSRIREITSLEATQRPFYRKNFAAIERMAALAKEDGVGFYVFIYPVLVQLKENTFGAVYGRIGKELHAKGINSIDLTGGLAGHEERDLWITPFDQHPNELAHRIFLEKIRDVLRP